MARLNIAYDLQKNLGDMFLKGVNTSKHEDKKQTYQERREASSDLKEKGLKGKEYQRELDNINNSKNKIYMDTTFKEYSRICKQFSTFIIEQHGTRRISIEDSKQYIQKYIDKLIEEEKSPAYQKKCLSAICKATNSYMRDYYHQEVNYAKQTKTKLEKETQHQKYEAKYKEVLNLNSCIGIRREELVNLKISNIQFDKKNNICLVYCEKAKGGKNNINVIRDPKKIEVIELYYNKAKAEGRDTLITKNMISKDIDLHYERAKNARQEYQRVLEDIKTNDNKDYYKNLIINEMERKHKFKDKDDKQKFIKRLDKDYVCRGENATILKELDIETRYNRIGIMYVSLFCLNHYREDTTVQHYLAKK